MNTITKTCTNCLKEKNILDFYSHNTTKDGLSTWCIECHKKNSNENYSRDEKKRLEKIEKSKKYQQCPARLEASRAASKKYRDKKKVAAPNDN